MTLLYDDGDEETIYLNTENFKIINSAPQSNLNEEFSVFENDGYENQILSPDNHSKKKNMWIMMMIIIIYLAMI